MKINNNIYVLKLPSIMNPEEFVYPVVITNKDKMLLVDTGYPGEFNLIKEAIENEGLNFEGLSTIVLTHQDIDHVGTVKKIKDYLPNIIITASEGEEKYINGNETPTKVAALEKNIDYLPAEAKSLYEKMKGFYSRNQLNIDETLKDGQSVPGFSDISVINTPGHTPGHISLYVKGRKILIAGDAFVLENNKLAFTDTKLNYNDEMYVKSLKKLGDYDIKEVICYHGGIYKTNVNESIRELSSKQIN